MTLPTQYRFDFIIKIILLGDRSVGKSSFLAHLAQRQDHIKDHIRCVNFSPNSHVELDIQRRGKRILMRVVSTGGQERFRSITASYYRGTQGCLLMFDADNSNTFMNITKWHSELEMYTNHQPVTTFLVATNSNSSKRQVNPSQAESLATEMGLQYHQLSLKDKNNSGVDILETLLDKVLLHVSRLPSITLDMIPVSIAIPNTIEEKPSKFHCAC